MAVKNIITVPNIILEKMCEPVSDFGDKTKSLAQDLVDTLNHATEPEGAGLAAPQIGILKRICVVRRFLSDPNTGEPFNKDYILINPKIQSTSESHDTNWEACLSIPDTYGKVSRPKRITITYQDLEGKTQTQKATGFFARVIQHEMDHLDGVLFTTKVIGNTISEKEMDKIIEAETKNDLEDNYPPLNV